MPRYEINGYPISVHYGYDDDIICQVFLSVFDKRLEWDENASKEVNSAAETSLYIKDGGGCYFSLTTSPLGIGLKVNKDTMRVYMKRFGVPEQHIRSVLRKEPIVETLEASVLGKESESSDINRQQTEGSIKSFCVHCKTNYGSKRCSRCMVACYCSRSCQVKDWPVHKFFCGSLPFPKPVESTSGKTVRAVYLPELTEDPVLINLPIMTKICESDDDCDGITFEAPDLENYLGKDYGYGRNFMPLNPLKEDRVIADTIEFRYRENFGTDGSKLNQCIQKITQNCSFHDWKGPMVVTKYSGKGVEGVFLDLEVCDFVDIVDFFVWYGSQRSSKDIFSLI